jgi:hypothetical protein
MNPRRVPARIRSCVIDTCVVRILSPRLFCPDHWDDLPDYLHHEIGDARLDNDAARLRKLVLRAQGITARLNRRRR